MIDIDYPKTLTQFNARFAGEVDCYKYLVQLRWPSSFKCPNCTSSKAWLTKRGLMNCTQCRRQTSVTAGTLFHRTKSPLQLWFHAIWWLTAQKNGASALGLQRILGLGSYETAWTWLHKLRRAMVIPGRALLNNGVEVDETFVGGVDRGYGKGRRHIGKKALIMVAAEIRGNGIGRIRLQCVPDSTAESLIGFVKDVVAPGSIVVTDGFSSYHELAENGYLHQPRVITGVGKAHTLLPRVHRVSALLKRWLLGTHQGRIERSHLPYYI